MGRRLRVAVLFGGRSGEHEVSLLSAQSVLGALDSTRYEVLPVGITKEGRWLAGPGALAALQAAAEGHTGRESAGTNGSSGEHSYGPGTDRRGARPLGLASDDGVPRFGEEVDIVFPVLHGPFGEDGTVQGLLELLDVPYVGCGVAASAVGMDKALMKCLLRDAGLPIADFMAVERRAWRAERGPLLAELEARFGYPCFVKPANMGSSVGVSKAHDRAELGSALDLAARHDRKLIVERNVVGREIECSVLGNDEPRASVPGEIIPVREFYDYEAKYGDAGTKLVIPADMPAEVSAEVRRLAIAAFRALDCAGMARVDFFVASQGRVYVNEVNTIPGFTQISMYPKLWAASGIPYPELLDRLISLGLERHRDRPGVQHQAAHAER